MFGQWHVHHHSRVSDFTDVSNDVYNECCRGIGPTFCTKKTDYTKCNDYQNGHHTPQSYLHTFKYFFSARCSVYLTKCMQKIISDLQNQCHFYYSAINGFWSVEELAELADGPDGWGKMARGWCLREKVSCTDVGREKFYTKHDAELVIRS